MECHAGEFKEQELCHAREVMELQETQQTASDKAIEDFTSLKTSIGQFSRSLHQYEPVRSAPAVL